MFSVNWPVPPHVKTLQTTRLNGMSNAPFNSLNLGAHVGDKLADVTTNRAKLAVPQPVLWLNQTHSDNALELPLADYSILDKPADAVYSFKPNQVCAVMTADCLPVLLTDTQGQFVAAVHCGWRGLASTILTKTLAKISQNIAYDPANILVWLGPAIGPQQFEVGAEVKSIFSKLNPVNSTAFNEQSNDKYLADIYQLANNELTALGIKHIFSDYECTVSQPDKYFSYRRDGITGRQASLIWLGP
ncbi:peptidoglycan editing factor PgeF [Catenovulum sp. 2E275]|uniref:peptidoglycan editing factor PgeF n=1 Tax=Catenovulum sp. 2E275 TaxID=2980497 RepID=UPI0021D1E592|nr:peptidoglycan editing factor PgeF [Catenovulum sp. 2E275]MCU4675704.1 peptidoglycan editing factor PgeF [Catenovulum sp. 2E275]